MFRFTIRELVLVTVIVAMGVAWWIDRRAQFSDASSRTKKHQSEVARLESEIANLNNLIDQVRLLNGWWKSWPQSTSPDATGIVPPPGAKLRDGFTPDSSNMRYKLRTLLLLLAVLPPLLWIGWGKYQAWRAEQEKLERLKFWLNLPSTPPTYLSPSQPRGRELPPDSPDVEHGKGP